MKKTYQSPSSLLLCLQTEGMMAESLVIGSTGGDQMLSNKKGSWSSEDWEEEAEEPLDHK